MLVAAIRPVETRTLDINGDSLEDLSTKLYAACPPGWEVASLPKREIVRRDGVQEIETEDMAALTAKVPDGWQMLSVRKL